MNETAARRFYPGVDPLGRTYDDQLPDHTKIRLQVIGIVKDAKYRGLRDQAPATIYVPIAQNFTPFLVNPIYEVRFAGPLPDLTPRVRAAFRAADPRIALDSSSSRHRLTTRYCRSAWWRALPSSSVFWRCCWPRSAFTGWWLMRWCAAAARSASAWLSEPPAEASFGWCFAKPPAYWRSAFPSAWPPRWLARAWCGRCFRSHPHGSTDARGSLSAPAPGIRRRQLPPRPQGRPPGPSGHPPRRIAGLLFEAALSLQEIHSTAD